MLSWFTLAYFTKRAWKKDFTLPNCKTLAGYNEFNAVCLLGMSDSVSNMYCVNNYPNATLDKLIPFVNYIFNYDEVICV